MVRFVAAKVKVAPMKATSIPHLELMAAVLGVKLSRKVVELLQIRFEALQYGLTVRIRHHITRLIVADVLNRCHHAGVNHVLSQVQHHYWVVDGRQEVKNWDRDCQVCKKWQAEPAVQIMAPLPESRLGTIMRAFGKCCVDFAGLFVTMITQSFHQEVLVLVYMCSHQSCAS